MFAHLAHEWRSFRADPPGARFRHQYERGRHTSRAAKITRIAIGVLLIAVGIALLFLPGPGIIVGLFGLALLSARWRWLATRLDHGEARIRRMWRHRPWNRRRRRRRRRMSVY